MRDKRGHVAYEWMNKDSTESNRVLNMIQSDSTLFQEQHSQKNSYRMEPELSLNLVCFLCSPRNQCPFEEHSG